MARARGRPATSAPNLGLYLRRDLPRRGRAPGWSCPGATPAMDECGDAGSVSAAVEENPCGAGRRSGRLALDEAGDPHNIVLESLPPRSPELNPVENVWQFMRDNWLSNRIFKSRRHVACAASPQPHRNGNHVPRHAQMGAWVLINDRWYYMAIGHLNDGTIAVVFAVLGTEGVSVISMRPASRKERNLL